MRSRTFFRQCAVLLDVHGAGPWTFPPTRLSRAFDETDTGSADPAHPAGRDTHDEGEVRHVLGDHGARGDHGPAADADGCNAHRTRADGRAVIDPDAHGFPVPAALLLALRVDGALVVIIGEHHCRADEHAVTQLCGLVHQRVVLQLAVVSHTDTRADVGPPPDHASLAEPGTLADLSEVPHAAPGADFGVLVHLGAGLNPVVHFSNLPLTASLREHTVRRMRSLLPEVQRKAEGHACGPGPPLARRTRSHAKPSWRPVPPEHARILLRLRVGVLKIRPYVDHFSLKTIATFHASDADHRLYPLVTHVLPGLMYWTCPPPAGFDKEPEPQG